MLVIQTFLFINYLLKKKKKKKNNVLENTAKKAKDWATQTPLKTGVNLGPSEG